MGAVSWTQTWKWANRKYIDAHARLLRSLLWTKVMRTDPQTHRHTHTHTCRSTQKWFHICPCPMPCIALNRQKPIPEAEIASSKNRGSDDVNWMTVTTHRLSCTSIVILIQLSYTTTFHVDRLIIICSSWLSRSKWILHAWMLALLKPRWPVLRLLRYVPLGLLLYILWSFSVSAN